MVAVPLGLMTAIYLHLYAGPRAARVLSAAVSCLAGVPTVVYGYFALNFVTPALARVWPGTEAFNGASASLVTGADDPPGRRRPLPSCPRVRASLPAGRRTGTGCIPGAGGRQDSASGGAAGHTGRRVAGSGPRSRRNHDRLDGRRESCAADHGTPLEGIRTLTAFIVQTAPAGSPPGGLEYRALFVVGTFLFVGTYAMHAAGRAFLARPLEQEVQH